MERTGKKYPALRCLSLMLTLSLSFPFAVPGAQKPEGMEEGQWERLQDNVLEYDELALRVEYFNPTILQIIDQVNEGYDTVRENILDYQETANDFLYLQEKKCTN